MEGSKNENQGPLVKQCTAIETTEIEYFEVKTVK